VSDLVTGPDQERLAPLKIEFVFPLVKAYLAEQFSQSKFSCKKLFWYFSMWVGSDD